MKILITAPSLDAAENVSGISSLVRQIVKRGSHEFFHFQAGRKDGEGSGLRWLWKQPRMFAAFHRAIRKTDPDIVHINTSLVSRAIVRDALLLSVARRAGKPVVLHVHGGPFVSSGLEKKRFAANMLRDARKVIVLSDIEKDALLKQLPGLDIDVLPNAVPTGEIPERLDRPGEKSIIYFGRLDANKGLDTIIEACAKLKERGFDFRFNCYGTGPDGKHFIDRMLDALGDRFYYGGVVTGAQKWYALAENDIFLMPSRYEGLPMALLETMAAGCVPVVSNVGSISTVVENGRNGCLVEPGDVEKTVEILGGLLQNDLSDMSKQAQATIRDRFDMEQYIERLDEIYREALE